MGVARHARACPKCTEIIKFQYLVDGLRFCFDFFHVNKVPGDLSVSQLVSQSVSQSVSASQVVSQCQPISESVSHI